METVHQFFLVVRNKDGKELAGFELKSGSVSIGRDQTNTIVLPNNSVSRKHAEISIQQNRASIKDLNSRNGTVVNGVSRSNANLQPGDKMQVGCYTLELHTGAPLGGRTAILETPVESIHKGQEQTVEVSIELPEPRNERQLITLKHLSFWVAEGVEEKNFVPRSLQLLRRALNAREAHFYNHNLELQNFNLEKGTKPAVKLAPFVAELFQTLKEATILCGRDIPQQGQPVVARFNYLIGPLRAGKSSGVPFLVLVRPADEMEFATDDRVFLEVICQLWGRGQARADEWMQVSAENSELKKVVRADLLGESPAMQKLRNEIKNFAFPNLPVLLLGESGTGKELGADMIHHESPRSKGPFVKINCAVNSHDMIEAELFGYSKGAFTGAARDHKGLFIQADGGTLFLDEIGEMSVPVQAKLLRAIEYGEVQVMGKEGVTKVNVRLVAATNRNLPDMVREGKFREDLFFRLNVLKLRLPPLREHKEDIELLATRFLSRFCEQNGYAAKQFSPQALGEMGRYGWPGNVRELQNLVMGCATSVQALVIEAEHVVERLKQETEFWSKSSASSTGVTA